MYSLQKVLQYLAQVAGAGVSQQNVVAFSLVLIKEKPLLLYSSNEDVDIGISAKTGFFYMKIGNWNSDGLQTPSFHSSTNEHASASALGSQSKHRLTQILSGEGELSPSAVMAIFALKSGDLLKVSQPDDFRSHQFGGFGFIHAEMLLLNFIVSNGLGFPSQGRLSFGISKRLCAYCATAISFYEKKNNVDIMAPSAHWLTYLRWRVPLILVDSIRDIQGELNYGSKKGKVFSISKRSDQAFIENDSKYKDKCDQLVMLSRPSEQYGDSSPLREEPPEEDTEIIWICPNSKCELYYGKQVTPQESGGTFSRLVCPFCTREVVKLTDY